jgi:hypothetical protein
MEASKSGVKAPKVAAKSTRPRTSSTPRSLDVVSNSDDLSREALALVRTTSNALAAAAARDVAEVSTDLVSELNNIDFKKMIGGPLQAAVDAQVTSSIATINFIKEVGFVENAAGQSELVMVDFSHKRHGIKADGTADDSDVFIKVPLLAMVQIPSLRIEHVTIDFNVKLNSVETSNVSSTLDLGAEVSGGWGPVKFKVSAAYQRKASTGVEVKKEYALNVNVKAVQDEIAPGLEKILNMLAA